MATYPTLNPDLPADSSPLDPGEMRNQFAGIQWRFDKFATPQPLGLTVSNPPTQAEMQAIADKLDEAITTLQGG